MITGNHTIPADNWKLYQTSRQLETIPDQQTTGNHTRPADNWKPYQTSRQLQQHDKLHSNMDIGQWHCGQWHCGITLHGAQLKLLSKKRKY